MFESNKELLTLCYDTVEEIRDGFYIVSDKGLYGVIDAGNNVIIEIKHKKSARLGDILLIGDEYRLKAYSTTTFKEIDKTNISDIEKFSDHAYIATGIQGQKGIINDRGQLILPFIYRNIWVSTKNSKYDFIKALLDTQVSSIHTRDIPYIKINKSYTECDCVYAIDTGIEGCQIVATELNISHLMFEGSKLVGKYKVRWQGEVVGREYNDIMERSALRSHGLLQTYEYVERYDDIMELVKKEFRKYRLSSSYIENKLRVKTGLCSIEGEVIVEPIYDDLTYIGNGIALVKKDGKYGTVVNKVEVERCGDLDTCFILSGLPITACIKRGVQNYIGNDGKAREKIEEAFPVYKSNLDSNINLICMYGTWIYVDNRLKRIMNIDDKLKDQRLWTKL